MRKTTPEEAIALARKHHLTGNDFALSHFVFEDCLAALIDEVRRVNAEPVAWRTRYRSEPGMIGHYPWSYTDRIRRMQLEKYEYEPLYTHPAPSQPAVQRWKLVPEEPTAKMCAAADEQKSYDVERGTVTLGSNIYRAMLDAAPIHEPAAPVELPIFAWYWPSKIEGVAAFSTNREAVKKFQPAAEPLVKLRDAQAALRAAQKG